MVELDMKRLVVLLLLVVGVASDVYGEERRVLHQFKRQQLTNTYYSEGANFGDINHAVSGFQGGDYPFAAPCDCPGQSCP